MRSQVQVLAGPPPSSQVRALQAASRGCPLPAWAALGPPAYPRRHLQWPLRGRPPGRQARRRPRTVVAHPAEDASHAAGAATSRCSLLPCPPRGRRGPHPTRRPGSATDLPLTTRCRQRRPRPGLLDRRSSRRRPGSHRGLTRSGGQGRPATSTWSPTPPPEHGRRRTRPDRRGQTADGWTPDGWTADGWTLDGWTADGRPPDPVDDDPR
jgi:hypothetical protein